MYLPSVYLKVFNVMIHYYKIPESILKLTLFHSMYIVNSSRVSKHLCSVQIYCLCDDYCDNFICESHSSGMWQSISMYMRA